MDGAFLRLARVIGGSVLIPVGIAGLFLPILPGWLLIIPGLALWGREFDWAARLLNAITDRLDRFRHRSERRVEEWRDRRAA